MTPRRTVVLLTSFALGFLPTGICLGQPNRAAAKRPARDLLMLAFAYRYGMRTAELLDLPRRNVDTTRWEIEIQGKKNGLVRRYSIPADLKPLIRRYLRDRDDSVPQFFTGQRGRLHRIRAWQIFKECMAAAGLRDDVGLHSLRHSAAVHGLDSGLTTDDLREKLYAAPWRAQLRAKS